MTVSQNSTDLGIPRVDINGRWYDALGLRKTSLSQDQGGVAGPLIYQVPGSLRCLLTCGLPVGREPGRAAGKGQALDIVSEGDLKAYPGQNAITAKLEQEGPTVNRAVWNGHWSATEFDRAYQAMVAEGAAVKYVALKSGTVVLPGQVDDGGSNHINTWRIAYDIEGLRAWLFAHHK